MGVWQRSDKRVDRGVNMTKMIAIEGIRYVAMLSKEAKTLHVGCGATKEVALDRLIDKTNLEVALGQRALLVSGHKLTKKGFTIEIGEIS